MASVDVIVLLSILFVLQPMIATSDLLSPHLPPSIENICENLDCGKGKCKASRNSSLFYECECDLGWKQTLLDQNDDLKFLPCVVPNCTLNNACMEAPAPVQDKWTHNNESIFDLCHWIDCWGGSCKKTNMFSYSCECAADHYNLLNISTYPCIKECAIGMDCKKLGVSKPVSVLPDNSKNQESASTSTSLGNVHWLMLLMMSLALLH